MNYSEILFDSILEAGIPILKDYILPLLVWVLIPATAMNLIFKNDLAWQAGAVIGLLLFIFTGPLFF